MEVDTTLFYKQLDMHTLLGLERKIAVDGDGLPIRSYGEQGDTWDGVR